MTTVDQLIGDLLLRHNCVIIPSFGGFVAKPVSARIDYKNGSMLPPSKSLLFNRQLINNDGLLTNELAQSNTLSFDVATAEVRERVAQWNNDLKNGGRIEIDRVGHLFFDEEQNICFEQDRFFNLLLESFGLSTVHFLSEEDVQIVEKKIELQSAIPAIETKLVEQEEVVVEKTPIIPIVAKVEKTEASKEETKVVEHTVIVRKKRPWKYIAAACILPILFYSVWIPMKSDVLESGMISVKDFNPFHKTSEGSYVKEEFTKKLTIKKQDKMSLEEEVGELNSDTEYYTFNYDGETNIKVSIPSKVESTDVNVELQPEVNDSFDTNQMNYIVGCFGDESNAINLVAKLKASGMDARVFDNKNGLHRVTAGSAISVDALAKIKVQANELGVTGWTLK